MGRRLEIRLPRREICAVLLTLGLAVAAHAKELKLDCKIPSEGRKSMGPGLVWQELTPAQYHFIQGVYVGSPDTARGLPPGDGAMIARGKDGGLVVWTIGKRLWCNPIKVDDPIIELILGTAKNGDDAL